MFARRFHVELIENGEASPVPKPWLDQFFMRNFIGFKAFDETLVTSDGEMEASYAVSGAEIRGQFEKWLRGRKIIGPSVELRVREQ